MEDNRNKGNVSPTFAFNERAKNIGEMLHCKAGADGLFETMRILSEMVLYQKNQNIQTQYYKDLRELEFLWTGITPDFQA